MEACVGAHHLSRRLKTLGHPRLMPAKYAKAFLKGNKNDFRDAEAIAEAVQRPTMRFVAAKTAEQLDLQALHRVRSRLVRERTATVNEIRAFLLDRGVAVAQGLHRLRAALPGILATRIDVLSPRLQHIIEDLVADWRHLDERIDAVSLEIETLANQDAGCERLMTVPGIGPIISSATVAAIGTGDVFSKGRGFGAWLGLVPKQISTGDRTILGKISKRGNKYLRTLFVQAARVVLLRPASWERHAASSAGSRRPPNGSTTTCWRSQSPTSSRASPGACCIMAATSRSGRCQNPCPHEEAPISPACRARRCQGRALRVALKRVSLDSLCARRPRHPGRSGREKACGAVEQEKWTDKGGGDHASLRPHSPPRSAREKGSDGATVFPARSRTGDPNSPLEACPIIRSNARLHP